MTNITPIHKTDWLPIASAPHDGDPVELAWAPNGALEQTAVSPGWTDDGWTDGIGGFWIDATHWRRP